ncbi:hypothetical protein C9I98_09910 [Photobacterium sanctipauli]|uniref:Type VI secretion system baseplate subunit TssE n=1 Tax=Photobacterium sanctipauli TaxID=1342794 RepID=A0A2T3NU48_9GAMM|nr:hypothetical protein [Photobacterium sanctipauli]PSW19773.1 hypothetical protein C9I98_09910 [Photobacterium sanctipauli]
MSLCEKLEKNYEKNILNSIIRNIESILNNNSTRVILPVTMFVNDSVINYGIDCLNYSQFESNELEVINQLKKNIMIYETRLVKKTMKLDVQEFDIKSGILMLSLQCEAIAIPTTLPLLLKFEVDLISGRVTKS